MRGEYQKMYSDDIFDEGSPPLARGIPGATEFKRNEMRITPACAGNTMKKEDIVKLYGDHPRLRGEYKLWSKNLLIYLGSPPLARGIH